MGKQREGETDKDHLIPTVSLPKWSQQLGLGQIEAKSEELRPGLPPRWQGPKPLGYPPLPSQINYQGA